MGPHRYWKLIFYTQHNRHLVLEYFLDNTGQKTKHSWIIFLKSEHRENNIVGKIIKISIFKIYKMLNIFYVFNFLSFQYTFQPMLYAIAHRTCCPLGSITCNIKDELLRIIKSGHIEIFTVKTL